MASTYMCTCTELVYEWLRSIHTISNYRQALREILENGSLCEDGHSMQLLSIRVEVLPAKTQLHALHAQPCSKAQSQDLHGMHMVWADRDVGSGANAVACYMTGHVHVGVFAT